MAEATEKITINLGVVDLGKIDILVEQGFYANRTDFIKDAIRRSLDVHSEDVRRTLDRLQAESGVGGERRDGRDADKTVTVSVSLGILGITKTDLERHKRDHKRMRIFCAGLVIFGADVTPELANEVIDTFKVYGSVRASDAVLEVLRAKAPGLRP